MARRPANSAAAGRTTRRESLPVDDAAALGVARAPHGFVAERGFGVAVVCWAVARRPRKARRRESDGSRRAVHGCHGRGGREQECVDRSVGEEHGGEMANRVQGVGVQRGFPHGQDAGSATPMSRVRIPAGDSARKGSSEPWMGRRRSGRNSRSLLRGRAVGASTAHARAALPAGSAERRLGRADPHSVSSSVHAAPG